jgi:hypothetical protein
MKITTAIAIALAMGGAPLFAKPARGGGFEVSTLSANPDMVSGGDVLIRIVPLGSGGNVNDDASKGMAMVPIIDARPYTEANGDAHDTVNGYITRDHRTRGYRININVSTVPRGNTLFARSSALPVSSAWRRMRKCPP